MAAVSGIGMPDGTRTSPVLRTTMSPTAMRSVIFLANALAMRLGLLDDFVGRTGAATPGPAEVLVEGAQEGDRAELAALVDADAEGLLLRDVQLHQEPRSG